MNPTHQHTTHPVFKFLFLLLFGVSISGCSSIEVRDNPIWDYVSENLEISLLDDYGQPLIDPTTTHGLALLKEISISYKGVTYPLEDRPGRSLRAVIEQYRAFFLNRKKNSYYLSFGEFQPKYGELQVLTLNLPGDELVRISFTHTVNRKHEFESKVWVGEDLNPQTRDLGKVVVHPKNNGEAFRPKTKEDVKPAPVTLYVVPFLPDSCFSTERDKTVIRPEIYPDITVTYKNKVHTIVDDKETKESLFGVRVSESNFLYTHPSWMKKSYFAIGPFSVDDNLQNELILLHYKEQSIPVRLSCFRNADRHVEYYAQLENAKDGPYSKEKLYFRNGPLVFANWSER